MKDLKKAKLDALRPQNQPTQEAHLAEVERLEREHSQSGRQLVEAEGSVTKKQSELSRWRVEKEEVGKLEVGDEGAWADGKVYVPIYRRGRVLEMVLIDRIRLKLFTDAGFTLIPGKGNSGSKVLIRKSILYFHQRMITDNQGTRRNRIYIRYHSIIRGRRRIMLISFGGLLGSREALGYCCFAIFCTGLYLMYRVSALLSIVCP
jgi:hypothetical protein